MYSINFQVIKWLTIGSKLNGVTKEQKTEGFINICDASVIGRVLIVMIKKSMFSFD